MRAKIFKFKCFPNKKVARLSHKYFSQTNYHNSGCGRSAVWCVPFCHTILKRQALQCQSLLEITIFCCIFLSKTDFNFSSLLQPHSEECSDHWHDLMPFPCLNPIGPLQESQGAPQSKLRAASLNTSGG